MGEKIIHFVFMHFMVIIYDRYFILVNVISCLTKRDFKKFYWCNYNYHFPYGIVEVVIVLDFEPRMVMNIW